MVEKTKRNIFVKEGNWMKKIIIITTGGTIAMKYDETKQGLVPAVSGDDLVEAVPALRQVAEVEVVEYANVPSGHVTPAMMLEIAHLADQYASRPDVAGIVVTHGTDTMEETAYVLSLACTTTKPVCITGAMRGASDMGYDGLANLLGAVRVAACPEAAGRGALLIFNDEIHAAAQVTKGHTVSCSTFISPMWGPVGYIYFDGIVFRRSSQVVEKLPTEQLTEGVELLQVYAGMDGRMYHYLADRPVQGLVVEAVGCGNVPPKVMEGIAYVRSKGVPVVLATRVPAGRVAPVYSYLGSAGSMEPLALLLAGELSGPKARLKLMLALSHTHDNDELQKIFAEPLY